MSVVDRFKKRETINKTVLDITLESGVVLKVARVGVVEIDRAKQLTRVTFKTELKDVVSSDDGAMYTFAHSMGTVLLDHVKGWTLPEGMKLDFNPQNLKEFASEFSVEERTELGLKYWQAVEADSEIQKKILDLYLQSLSTASKPDSITNSDNQNSLAETAPASLGQESEKSTHASQDVAALPN